MKLALVSLKRNDIILASSDLLWYVFIFFSIMFFLNINFYTPFIYSLACKCSTVPGVDLGGGCRGCAPVPPPSRDDLWFSNTTGILQKKNYVVYWC